MAREVEYGVSKRGRRTVIYRNFEYWQHKVYDSGKVLWKCSKYQTFKCRALLHTDGEAVVGNDEPEHTHSGNVSTSRARQAVGKMKRIMEDVIATPSAAQGSIISEVPGHIQIALPKRASLSRVLRRHRQIKSMVGQGTPALPAIPDDVNFAIPPRFQDFVLHDSGPGNDRMLLLGDREVLEGLGRAQTWLADGTFKVVPSLFYQLYSVHYEAPDGSNPSAIYCLLVNKTRATYDNMLAAIKAMVPNATPRRILLDFESAAMNAFQAAYPDAQIKGCYFHLCQSVTRKVGDVGLKGDYETDDGIRGFVRCLCALSHVPEDDVVNSFEALCEDMPMNEKLNELVSYFEHTYIRGRRRPGRGDNYGTAIFPIPLWNQYESAGDGIARTTNSVEGWHFSLQCLFMCQHPTMWTFLTGLQRDCQVAKAGLLQAASGSQNIGKKKFRDLKDRVARAVAGYGHVDRITYLRAIAYLSHA